MGVVTVEERQAEVARLMQEASNKFKEMMLDDPDMAAKFTMVVEDFKEVFKFRVHYHKEKEDIKIYSADELIKKHSDEKSKKWVAEYLEDEMSIFNNQ
jgi:uncharacterized membrane protein YqiK